MMGDSDPNVELPARVKPQVDRNLIEHLLQDKELSYREVARRARCSDWTVRRVARQLAGDERPVKNAPRVSGRGEDGWLPIVMLAVLLLAGIGWLRAQGEPPPGGYPIR